MCVLKNDASFGNLCLKTIAWLWCVIVLTGMAGEVFAEDEQVHCIWMNWAISAV